MENKISTKNLDLKRNILNPLGFKEIQSGVFTHKMMEGQIFDFSSTDPDVFWIMDRIFKVAVAKGVRDQQLSLLRELGINQD